jgi:tetratricopeptide (TPR) repeat protein
VAQESQPAISATSGQLSTRFAIDPKSPESSVPSNEERNRNPLEFGYFLQDLLEQAEQARKAKDYPAVIRFYRAVAKAVPENAKGWSKLCEAYETVHDRDRAIVACRYAIDRPAVELQDFVRFVRLMVAKNGELADKERAELNAVLVHLDGQPGMELAASHLRCQVGVKAKDVAMMETCTQALAKAAPDDPKTMVFRWSLAMMKGQPAEAQRLLESARATGVPRESIALMESVVPSSGRSWRGAGLAGGTALTAAVVAALILTLRRRRTLGGRTAS